MFKVQKSILFLFIFSATMVSGSVTGTLVLKDKSGKDQPAFSLGGNILIFVDDADRNLDTTKVDTITVLVSTDSEPNGKRLLSVKIIVIQATLWVRYP